MVPMKGIEPTHPAPFLKDQGPWTTFQAPDFQTFMFDQVNYAFFNCLCGDICFLRLATGARAGSQL